MFIVYILFSKTRNKYYIGHTENLENRIKEHIMRKNLGASDWELVYKESFATRGEAMQRELEIKSKKKRTYIEWLVSSAGT